MEVMQTTGFYATENEYFDQLSLTAEIRDFAIINQLDCLADGAALNHYATDFGKLRYSKPLAVFLPESVAALRSILHFANKKDLQVVPRAKGFSQGGQSLACKHGIVIDVNQVNKKIEFQKDADGGLTVWCGAGVKLKQLLSGTIALGYLPPVLPFYLELTVGGILSAGGIGSAAHLHGAFISNVIGLDVMLSDGSLVNCSKVKSQALFYAMLGTQGQFGIIISACLKLIPAASSYRTYRFLYNNIVNWLQDYSLLANTTISNLQGICNKASFSLEVTATGIEQDTVLCQLGASLRYDEILPATNLQADAFVGRYQSRFAEMKTSGKFNQYHPFLEFIVAEDRVQELIDYAFASLPEAFGESFRLIYINKKELPPYFMVPAAERICMFAVLPTGINEAGIAQCLQAATELHHFALQLGAKRYLSGFTGMMDNRAMSLHYGEQLPAMQRLKTQLDPTNTFRSSFSSAL